MKKILGLITLVLSLSLFAMEDDELSQNDKKTEKENEERLRFYSLESDKNLNVIIELLENGTNPDAKDLIGRTATHYASQGGNNQILIELIKKGANINLQTFKGYTPLHCAASEGRKETIELLLKAGACPDITNDDCLTPDELASKYGYLDIANLIEQYRLILDPSIKFLHFSILGNIKKMKAIIGGTTTFGTILNPNFQDATGRAPIHYATHYCHHECLNLLILMGCNVNIKDNQGNTPAHYSVLNSDIKSLSTLIKSRADFTIKNNLGLNPLLLAKTLKNNCYNFLKKNLKLAKSKKKYILTKSKSDTNKNKENKKNKAQI